MQPIEMIVLLYELLARAARRTFAVRLQRKGYDLRHIQVLLGVQSLTAVKRMVEADPVRLGAIVSRVV